MVRVGLSRIRVEGILAGLCGDDESKKCFIGSSKTGAMGKGQPYHVMNMCVQTLQHLSGFSMDAVECYSGLATLPLAWGWKNEEVNLYCLLVNVGIVGRRETRTGTTAQVEGH